MNIAIVTGGSRGIGAAVAKELAAAGFGVVVGYNANEEKALAVERAIRDAGGIVGINYYVDFVTDDARDLAQGTYSPEQLCAHIDRMLYLGGADVVALGSDFDGCSVPAWLAGAAKIDALVRVLRERYGDEQADKICWRNAHDFFCRNEG